MNGSASTKRDAARNALLSHKSRVSYWNKSSSKPRLEASWVNRCVIIATRATRKRSLPLSLSHFLCSQPLCVITETNRHDNIDVSPTGAAVLSSIIPQCSTTGEKRKRIIFRNDGVSRFGRGEEEPPPPASDRGVWSRENARARRDPHQNTHTPVLEHSSQTIVIFGGFRVRYKTRRRVKMQHRAIFPRRRKSRRDANETSRPSPAIRAARSFLFPKSCAKTAVASFFPIHGERCMSWTLSDSFCVANL